jgi:ABC-2 type transport system permease protein
MRIFVSTLRKLVRRPATVVTFALMSGLLVLILLAVASTRGVNQGGNGGGGGNGAASALLLLTFPGAYDLILGFILGLGGLFAVIYGAAVAGSEWTWGTLKSTVARGESRVLYALMTFVAVAFILAIGLLVTFIIGVVFGVLGATISGLPLDGLSDSAALGRLPALFLRGWVAISAEAAIGFTVATLARSQLAGIGVGIAFYFGETFASIFLPDIVRYLPFHLANTAVGEGGGGGFGNGPTPGALAPDTALVLISVWLLGSLVVASVFTDRAEITG